LGYGREKLSHGGHRSRAKRRVKEGKRGTCTKLSRVHKFQEQGEGLHFARKGLTKATEVWLPGLYGKNTGGLGWGGWGGGGCDVMEASMLLFAGGRDRRRPAYQLRPSRGRGGENATTSCFNIEGERRNGMSG